LLVGFCGGFTTFSAFAVENVQMLKSNHSLALGYFVLSAVGSIGAAALGMWISQCSR
jgi:CrcB protein